MKISPLRYALVPLLASGALLTSAQTSFYGGDFDGRNAVVSERNTSVADARVYDDFTLSQSVNVLGMYGTFLLSPGTNITGLHYEIRQGVSAGKGGTTVFSGDVSATPVDTGVDALGLDVFRITSGSLNLGLGAGTYYLSLAAIGNGSGDAYLATTDGTNGVGAPLGNGGSFIDSTTFGNGFDTIDSVFNETYDFSQGFTARPVPEPATFAALGLGAFALVRRRKAQ